MQCLPEVLGLELQYVGFAGVTQPVTQLWEQTQGVVHTGSSGC